MKQIVDQHQEQVNSMEAQIKKFKSEHNGFSFFKTKELLINMRFKELQKEF